MDKVKIEEKRGLYDEYSQTDDDGIEFWYARDLMEPMGYSRWENFSGAIQRAALSCENAKMPVDAHFREVTKMVESGVAPVPRQDFMLTRYACYLVAQNGDPSKDEIALAQAYFALETRKQELLEQRVEEIQRLQSRHTLTESEKRLAGVAFERGVDSRGFAIIKSEGDRALFLHPTSEMKSILGLSRNDALADGFDTVAIDAKNLANSMTAYNVEANDLRGMAPIKCEHIANNSSVRSTLIERGIYPESLPPKENAKKLERRLKADERRLKSDVKGFCGNEAEDE